MIFTKLHIPLQQSSFHLSITCQTLSVIGWFHSQHLYMLDLLCSSFFLSDTVLQFFLIFLFLQRESALAPGGRYNARQTMERQETQIGNCKCIKMIPLYHCKCIIDTLYHAFKIVIVSIWYNVPCPRNCKLNQWYIVPCSQKCKCINDTLYHAFKIH